MRLLVFIALTGLLSLGAECFKLSQKEYENIEQIVESGVQVFLNCMDKVREAAEKIVRDDMLRTNRIAIQGHWNSFKETANKISTEERGKGVQDDLIVAARTFQRLVLYYKDDVNQVYNTIVTEPNVQQYLPLVNTFKGTIERTKVKEILGNLVSNYFPDAPPFERDPMEFLCYLLSTNAVESVIVNVLKLSVEVILEIKKIDFDKISESINSFGLEVIRKYYEIERAEKQKESDEFLVLASVSSRVIVYYWDKFLNYTYIPGLEEKYANITKQFEQNYLLTLYELVTPIMEWETAKDIWRLYLDFSLDFHLQVIGTTQLVFYYVGEERCSRTIRALIMRAVVDSNPIYERLSEMGVFSDMKKVYLRAVNVAMALAGTEGIQYFSETYEKWKTFIEEINKLVAKDRHRYYVPISHVRAIARLLMNKSQAFVNRINADIDDDTIKSLKKNLENLRVIFTKKLLASGAVTQDQLDEAQRTFVDDILGVFGKYDEKFEDTFKALLKVLVVRLKVIYTQLAQAWEFLAV
ncbi:uncharacterized protein [Hoplias malabaricus]|uniref:uncharacterized protein isoform X2 n=1 Tax=Hoplias malabaricus TaxID=27720 RepID=UPI003461B0A3